MEQYEDAMMVYTCRSLGRVLREGGSGEWVLNQRRASLCKWLVCAQNRNHPDHDFSHESKPHGSAFLVGKISAIVKLGDRWFIQISKWAEISIPNAWYGQFPVRYTSLAALGIDPDSLEFKPMPTVENKELTSTPSAVHTQLQTPAPLTIAEAKRALAANLGVSPEAVEIVIRG